MSRMSSADSPSPPRIGLTSYRNRASWGVWNESADLLPANYAESVGLAGGAPVLLPAPAASATRSVEDLARAVLGGLDGLVLTGGPDVDPARYGAEKDPNTQRPKTERDEWEIALVRLAVELDLPTFCICRGMQTLNVALGGTLIQHLPDRLGHDEHSPTPGVHGRHAVRTAPDTRIAAIIGERAEVATYHHQAVDALAEGMVATAWADDGTIEAAELTGSGWLLAVQWHPEVADGAGLFADFVAAASAHSTARV
jgi:putative glutamine amidotransferase